MRLGFWTTIALALGILALAGLAGCGDFGATDEELAEAERKGEVAGRALARSNAEHRVHAAYEAGWWEAAEESEGEWAKGWSKGWDDAEEAFEEEELDYSGRINPYPEKLNGELSEEFEPDDIERAEEASPAVEEYCEGAVSEAQEVGCLSHVKPSEVP